MDPTRQLLEQALRLAEEERASLAMALMDSLSPAESPDEGAWIDEIERRARRALAARSPGTDVDEALDRISLELGL
jgi:hypothetical protein